MKYIIKKEKVVYDSFFKIHEAEITHDKFDGGTLDKKRKAFWRKDSAAILIHETDTNKLLFTNQFRYPTINENGWIIELTAGGIEDNESPENAIRREVKEEIGYDLNEVTFISSFYVSPGGSTERIHLFYSEAISNQKRFKGGGEKYEKEDIELVKLSPKEAINELNNNKIRDAKTVIALQWFKLNFEYDN